MKDIQTHILDQVIRAQKQGRAIGLTGVCSAHPAVLQAALMRARRVGDSPVLIESTCNQVNQDGGYTGLRPVDFARQVRGLAAQLDFPMEKLVLGGDHLGPGVWQREPAEQAMQKAAVLVRDYVRAGYSKIHLDTSMRCGDDDPQQPLAKEDCAGRAAQLAQTAEQAYGQSGLPGLGPRYIIGTEVPPPGGAAGGEQELAVTATDDLAETIELTRQAFFHRGLQSAWERVRAVVVQPGVEFSSDGVAAYDRTRAAGLSRLIEPVDGMAFEAHSTDYQTRQALHQLVEDHFAILKVGPALTFAYREAIYALVLIEAELLAGSRAGAASQLREILEQAMLAEPGHWQRYYLGPVEDQVLERKYSYSDRVRYYWPVPSVQAALSRLIENLENTRLPLPLLSQYLPEQYRKVCEGQLILKPLALIADKIEAVLADYAVACGDYA